MQGICTYIPETNLVLREYIVAAIQLLLFMVLISLVPVCRCLPFVFSKLRDQNIYGFRLTYPRTFLLKL